MVSKVCDRVVVLHLGRVIAQGTFAAVMADPAVRRAYLGQVA
jgi:branched-chain amino acid transport system ATP-binding protein